MADINNKQNNGKLSQFVTFIKQHRLSILGILACLFFFSFAVYQCVGSLNGSAGRHVANREYLQEEHSGKTKRPKAWSEIKATDVKPDKEMITGTDAKTGETLEMEFVKILAVLMTTEKDGQTEVSTINAMIVKDSSGEPYLYASNLDGKIYPFEENDTKTIKQGDIEINVSDCHKCTSPEHTFYFRYTKE